VRAADAFGTAFRSIAAHKFRSTLTLLSIMVGTFSIVLMTSLASSGLATLQKGLEDIGGTRFVLVWSEKPKVKREGGADVILGIRRTDVERLRTELPHLDAMVRKYSLDGANLLSDEGKKTKGDVVASDADFFRLFDMRIAQGQAFDEEQNRRREPVCVVGFELEKALWAGNPIGHVITLPSGDRCRVIGRMTKTEHTGTRFGFDWNNLVVVPIDRMLERGDAQPERLMLVLRTTDREKNEVFKRVLNARLMEAHHGIDDFSILDFSGMLKNFERVFLIFEVFSGLLAGIALLVGGIGIMNMMLVSVSERVREIGIRKALGASPAAIGRQFLLEAAALSGGGGLLGCLAGLLVSVLVSLVLVHFMSSWQGRISLVAALLAVTLSTILGLVFGYFPARRAGRWDPVLALRS